MRNPYAPPSTRLRDAPAEKGSAAKAVIVGALVSAGGAYLGTLAVLSVYVIAQFGQGAGKAQALDALLAQTVSSAIGLGSIAVKLGFSALGGYVSARIAKHAEYPLGAAVAAISIAFELTNAVWRYGAGVKAAVCCAMVACVLVGVRLGVRRNHD